MKENQYWRDPFSTSMIMGGRVYLVHLFGIRSENFTGVCRCFCWGFDVISHWVQPLIHGAVGATMADAVED